MGTKKNCMEIISGHIGKSSGYKEKNDVWVGY
jgi:hypothetical protein